MLVWATGYASAAHSRQKDSTTQRNNYFSTFEFTTRFCLIQTETGLNSNVEKRACALSKRLDHARWIQSGGCVEDVTPPHSACKGHPSVFYVCRLLKTSHCRAQRVKAAPKYCFALQRVASSSMTAEVISGPRSVLIISGNLLARITQATRAIRKSSLRKRAKGSSLHTPRNVQ